MPLYFQTNNGPTPRKSNEEVKLNDISIMAFDMTASGPDQEEEEAAGEGGPSGFGHPLTNSCAASPPPPPTTITSAIVSISSAPSSLQTPHLPPSYLASQADPTIISSSQVKISNL
jgi:hypothetical protein